MSATFDAEGLPPGGATSQGGAAAWRQQLAARWQALAARERLGVALAGAVLGLYLVWALALAPAWRTLRETPPRIAQAEEELRQMRRLGDEAQSLRAQAPVRAEQSEAALRAATARLGTGASLGTVQGDRVTITFKGLPPADLAAWLSEVRNAARARVIEVHWRRSGSGYDGSATLLLPARS